ncbi:DUF397 domain-containing protein [Streptomyces sediminimaris]|uniref:DUF397 domain-containing protein n=1 Tax=Streptomyces sediminimaris TaxID=3383721 RepID=UPI003999A9B9
MWFTSSYSNGAGGECVECARLDTGILVRDSKRAGGTARRPGPALIFSSGAWLVFLGGIPEGERSAF